MSLNRYLRNRNVAYEIPERGNEWVSASISVCVAFSWPLFYLFVCPILVNLFLFNHILHHLIYYPLEACLFSIERQMEVCLDQKEGWGWVLGGVEEGEILIQI